MYRGRSKLPFCSFLLLAIPKARDGKDWLGNSPAMQAVGRHWRNNYAATAGGWTRKDAKLRPGVDAALGVIDSREDVIALRVAVYMSLQQRLDEAETRAAAETVAEAAAETRAEATAAEAGPEGASGGATRNEAKQPSSHWDKRAGGG